MNSLARLALALGMLGIGVWLLSGAAGGERSSADEKYFVDCNGNGIDDVLDLKNGWVADRNGNGQADDCDSDTAMYALVHGDYEAWKSKKNVSYVDVIYLEEFFALQFRYTVPRGDHLVRIAVSDSAGLDTVLVNRRQPSGAYDVMWRPPSMLEGRAHLSVEVDGKRYPVKLAWNWIPLISK